MLYTAPVAANLFVLGIFFIGLAYYGVRAYVLKKYSEGLKSSFAYFLIAIGGYFVIYGLFFSFFTPLPEGVTYSILFYDTMTILGFLSVLGGYVILKDADLGIVGIFALFAGVYAIISGWSGYTLGMTKEPIMLLALYLTSGLAGVLALPAIFTKNRVLAAVIVGLLIIAALIAFLIGGEAVGSHLAAFKGKHGP